MFRCDCPPDDCAAKVSRYLEGDRSAGDELVQKFQRLVNSIVHRVLGAEARSDHEDVCQAVFLRIFANLGLWEHRCPFCKWLAVVAARRAIDVTRLKSTTQSISDLEQIPDRQSDSPLDDETIEIIKSIVQRFPDDWQTVWNQWTEGVNREVIAQSVGKSVRTIQYWLAEMLDHVREQLGSTN